MNETKSIFASRTVWGALVAIAAQLLGVAGTGMMEPPAAGEGLFLDIAGLAGAAVALWGRMSATRRLG